MKKMPERTCVITKEQLPKQELLRIVRTPFGEVKVDETGKANGRGAYICNCVECLNKAIKSKALSRAFKMEVPEEVYESLRKEIGINEQ